MNDRRNFTRLVSIASIVLFGGLLSGCLFWKKAPTEEPPLPPQHMEITEAGLGPGDSLEISVYRHPELDRRMTIPQSGIIFLPLVGELDVKGVSATQLRRDITTMMDRYIVDPQVGIEVAVRPSQRITVLGEVLSPGVYPLNEYDPTFALDAIGSARGFTLDASKKAVILLRRVDGEAARYILDMKKAVNDVEFKYNPQLHAGDVVYVPSSLVANIDRFAAHLSRWLAPIISLEHAILLGYDVKDEISGDSDVNLDTNNNITYTINP